MLNVLPQNDENLINYLEGKLSRTFNDVVMIINKIRNRMVFDELFEAVVNIAQFCDVDTCNLCICVDTCNL